MRGGYRCDLFVMYHCWGDTMSAGNPCTCPGTRNDKMKNWVVTRRYGNCSAFNGYHFTPSDYSAISCTVEGCTGCWRTKADYVSQLPDGEIVNGKYQAVKK